MNFVLETNFVSELRKPRPNPKVIAWHAAQDPARLFVTTVTLAEVWQGFHALSPNHPDYRSIKTFASDLPRQDRVLNFDARAAAVWGKIVAQADGPLPLRDSLIAAIALSRGYQVVTRAPDRLSASAARFLTLGANPVAPGLPHELFCPIHPFHRSRKSGGK